MANVLTNSSEPSTSATNAPARPPIDLAAVLKRCGGDAKFAAAVTERFRVQAGVEVGKIETALAGGDTETLRRAAHSLKSMAAYVSADGASDLAKQIEELGAAKNLADVSPRLARLRDEINQATAWITENAAAGLAQCA